MDTGDMAMAYAIGFSNHWWSHLQIWNRVIIGDHVLLITRLVREDFFISFKMLSVLQWGA